MASEPEPLLTAAANGGGIGAVYAGVRQDRGVPLRALGLSVLALAIPVLGAILAPEWIGDESGMLLWLTALVPPFLLTYYRGWKGASVGLSAGMAVLALTQVWVASERVGTPDYTFLTWIVATFIAVCVGIGVLAELLRRERAAAESMALTDPLTRLPNRRHAGVHLDTAFSAAVRGQLLSVVLFDLDRFKQWNDEFGHKAGDEVLVEFGEILLRITRRMNLAARWGGEEFLAILNGSDGEGAALYAEKVLQALREHPFPWGVVTSSAGVAEYSPGMGSPELLLAAADQALYQAKEAGRDQVRIARREGEHEEGPAVDHVLGVSPTGSLSGAELATGNESILLVDDDDAERGTLARALRRLGYTVEEAADGEQALSIAASGGPFDLLVTDLLMPGMSGFSLGTRFESAHGPARILYLSGYVQGELSWRGAPGSATGFLEKPMSVEMLAEKVRSMIDGALPVR